jgi:hypothetical protein
MAAGRHDAAPRRRRFEDPPALSLGGFTLRGGRSLSGRNQSDLRRPGRPLVLELLVGCPQGLAIRELRLLPAEKSEYCGLPVAPQNQAVFFDLSNLQPSISSPMRTHPFFLGHVIDDSMRHSGTDNDPEQGNRGSALFLLRKVPFSNSSSAR